MEYTAIARNIKASPRKVRLVADSVKKQKSIADALSRLMLSNKRAADPVKKALSSAIANAVNNHKADKNGLVIKELSVQEGVSYKRYHYAARGRVRPYKKRTSHIRVVLMDKVVKKVESGKMKVKKEEKIEKKEVASEK